MKKPRTKRVATTWSLEDLGLRMHNWHASQGDPVYAVGSYFAGGRDYPDLNVVIEAHDILDRLSRPPHSDSFKKRDIAELKQIVSHLDRYIQERDYAYAMNAASLFNGLQDIGMSVAQALKLKEMIDRGGRIGGNPDKILDEANKILDGHGVEALRGEIKRGGSYHDERYYGDILGLYVNMGDTYNGTLVYDTGTGRFYATSMGDFIEMRERGSRDRYKFY